MFAAAGQPAARFKPTGNAWDWRHTSKLVIPVENPADEPVALLLRIGDEANLSLNGKIGIAPGNASNLTLWINAPSPRKMGMIGGPSRAAAGLEPHKLPITATEGSADVSRATSDAVYRGADLAQWHLGAVRRDEAAALQQLPRGHELGRRVIHRLSLPLAIQRRGPARTQASLWPPAGAAAPLWRGA